MDDRGDARNARRRSRIGMRSEIKPRKIRVRGSSFPSFDRTLHANRYRTVRSVLDSWNRTEFLKKKKKKIQTRRPSRVPVCAYTVTFVFPKRLKRQKCETIPNNGVTTSNSVSTAAGGRYASASIKCGKAVSTRVHTPSRKSSQIEIETFVTFKIRVFRRDSECGYNDSSRALTVVVDDVFKTVLEKRSEQSKDNRDLTVRV